jgi:hypothetical protein
MVFHRRRQCCHNTWRLSEEILPIKITKPFQSPEHHGAVTFKMAALVSRQGRIVSGRAKRPGSSGEGSFSVSGAVEKVVDDVEEKDEKAKQREDSVGVHDYWRPRTDTRITLPTSLLGNTKSKLMD